MIFARPQMTGWGRPMQQIPQPGMQPMQPMQPGAQMGQLSPELLARLQQMQGLGGFGMQMQNPQMGLGRPQMGIQPLTPASAYSLR
jgi:hypothetical protein